MNKLINRIAAVAALALAATPIVGLASAAHAAEPVVRIKVGDLRLSNPSDAAEFIRRTDAAGVAYCKARTAAERLGDLSARACRTDFQQAVDSQLNKTQHSQLRAARRVQPSMIASR